MIMFYSSWGFLSNDGKMDIHYKYLHELYSFSGLENIGLILKLFLFDSVTLQTQRGREYID